MQLIDFVRGFLRDRAGNFGTMTALLATPLIGVAGMAIDVGYTLDQRTALMAAADAAALGALSEKSASVAAALAMGGDGTVAVGTQDALHLFNAQLGPNVAAKVTRVDIDVSRSGGDLYSSLTFSAEVPTAFMSIFGYDSMQVSGTATATYQTNAFVDFYMLLDNTPSMGLGATAADIATMQRNTSDSCAFACHETQNPDNYYLLAKSLGVKMRIDVVREATQELTQDAVKYAQTANQYRMAVYSFGATAETAGLTEVAAMSADMAKVRAATDALDLMTTPKNNYKSNQLTDFDAALTSLKTIIGTGGNGTTSSNRQKVLFFVSDGVADADKPDCTEELKGTRCQEPIDTSFCTPLKQNGVKIAVLYTTYLPLPNDSWWKRWIKPFDARISPHMQACASPGYFFAVAPNEGIVEAMQSLFRKVISAPRLSG
ncbi:TadE/TadG family type IV pilus assembly protein [Rhizobium sp. CSW-27]|uniref:TadE/TadG family type IV pilus assembly protein n=1 Tax=Rhizobium sp. CSW-27 TaxID=2839985 RepID=UPI001C00A50B|nr:TadE/TadG family type IV pilus assembly protein [Rhizobium sp. CSW-27]MBT9372423.1 pilus assembly protein [Rhizobium sp. CSW-27]